MSDGKSPADISWDELSELQCALAEARSRVETVEHRAENLEHERDVAKTEVTDWKDKYMAAQEDIAEAGGHLDEARAFLDTSAAEVRALREVLGRAREMIRLIATRGVLRHEANIWLADPRNEVATPASPQPAALAPIVVATDSDAAHELAELVTDAGGTMRLNGVPLVFERPAAPDGRRALLAKSETELREARRLLERVGWFSSMRADCGSCGRSVKKCDDRVRRHGSRCAGHDARVFLAAPAAAPEPTT